MHSKTSHLVILSIVALCSACGGAPPTPPSRAPSTVPPPRPVSAPASSAVQGGSSDGTTCEDARDQNVEEVTIGASSTPDLSAKDLGAVLNGGQYLETCQIPHDSKVSVCVAVRNGAAMGVTIALDPPDPDLEKCVAAEVRKLSFPSHPRMDVVRTQF